MSEKFQQLTQVNSQINALPYVAEVLDDWEPICKVGGDCDSYATAKFQRLAELGWPITSLRLATCWVENNLGYHCVLLVDLDEQTFVLDNRQPYPTEFQLLDYTWDKVQIAGSQQWQYAKP